MKIKVKSGVSSALHHMMAVRNCFLIHFCIFDVESIWKTRTRFHICRTRCERRRRTLTEVEEDEFGLDGRTEFDEDGNGDVEDQQPRHHSLQFPRQTQPESRETNHQQRHFVLRDTLR